MAGTAGDGVLDRIRWPLRLTWAGLWAERLTRAFWPLWSVLIASIAVLAFGLQDLVPIEVAWFGLVGSLGGMLWALVSGLMRFRVPTRGDALIRLDAALPGRPIAALTDHQAIGAQDEGSAAVWRVHLARMAERAAAARPVAPDLVLAGRDPFALRYVALTALVAALMFGSIWRATSVASLTPGADTASVSGPVWEGWATPPAYTGKPGLYLNDITQASLDLPTGTRIQIRLYGEVGALTLAETVSARTEVTGASDPVQDFEVRQSGTIEIAGPGGRTWEIRATPDAAPAVSLSGEMTREEGGKMQQAFAASDDYGVTAGQAVIALDLPSADRRFGLSPDPEEREPITLDLPMPITGNRAEFSETLVEDLSKHPFANLPVSVTFTVSDEVGQSGSTPVLATTLPGRRFFDPLAAAVIEVRRDLLWSRANAPRSVEVLKAVTHRPEGFIRNERAYLRLRAVMRDLETASASLTVEARDTMADELWEIALLVEDGDLASALQRLQRAQDRLDEAIRNGADPAEIAELMQEMREALDDYMQQLAEESEQAQDQQTAENMQGLQMSGDQLQQMLDKLQQLMEEGRTAEAQELMEALRQLMENMQVTQGQGSGQGNSPGQQAMRELSETLRDQQGLSDDAFQDMQQGQPGQGQQGERQQGEGQQGQGQGQQGQGQQPGNGQGQGQQPGGQDGRSLAERQQDLRNRLNGLNGLPGDGTEAGEAGRQALEDAERAMRQAEEALRDGDLSGALDRQADAMEAMREGMRNFGEAMAQEQQPGQGAPGQGEAFGNADPNGQQDPLGRNTGEMGRIGSDRNMLQGEDVYRRAQDLLDEIRRRSGEQMRPDSELDYLRRLLENF
jgi:uncharacterized protein (TIGR02302 family)